MPGSLVPSATRRSWRWPTSARVTVHGMGEPMPDTATKDNGAIGDILRTSDENPVLHLDEVPDAPALEELPHPAPPEVVANFTRAREPDGRWCIRIAAERLVMSPAEAHLLGTDLLTAATDTGEIRRQKGFDT